MCRSIFRPAPDSPEFRFLKPAAEGADPARRTWPVWIAAALAVAVVGGIVAVRMNRPAPAIDDFWQPVFSNRRPVLLCVAHPTVFRLSGAARSAFEAGVPPLSLGPAEIAPDAEHYVGFGDALALANLAAFFKGHGKPVQLRMGNDVAFADLRGHPVVLIGAFTNQWTMEMTSDLRFTFERTAEGAVIRDRLTARTWSAAANRDYAVVARIGNSKSGEMAVTAAGLSHYGTQMAGEFLISAPAFEGAMQQAPADWRTRNLQLVLEADVIGRTPGPPRVIASYFWSAADQPGGNRLREAEGLP